MNFATLKLMQFPSTRMRRLRQANWVRALVAEHQLLPSDLIYPIFVQEGAENSPIETLPGIKRIGLQNIGAYAKQVSAMGIPAIALFPVMEANTKTEHGDAALKADNLICRAIIEVKSAVPELGIFADVALDPYTTHGHDGVLNAAGDVENDATLTILQQQALLLAETGADAVAPSDMMDGRVAAIRSTLESAGQHNTLIASYAAKYNSAFYGPFRNAIGSDAAIQNASKATYQMDPHNSKEALAEVLLDEQEGADLLIIKPGMPYLDVISEVATASALPVLGYQVSGEYSMLMHYAKGDKAYATRVLTEALLGFKRAGCAAILTYAAMEIAKEL